MTDESQLTLQVIELRKAGVFFSEISQRLGIHKARARYLIKRAIIRGETTLEENHLRQLKPKVKLGDGPYSLQWVQRVIANCKADENGCWIWQGFKAANGYGTTSFRTERKTLAGRGSRLAIVHREMYRVIHGKALTKWQYVCHHCDVKACCNPAHLFLGSPTDNSRDEIAKGRHPETKVTHCPRQHEYSPENTYITPSGARECRECVRARGRKRWREGRARLLQQQRRAAARGAST